MHPTRQQALDAAALFATGMSARGVTCVLPQVETVVQELKKRCPKVPFEEVGSEELDVELMVVFGGDGTILRAAELAVPNGIPLLGVNLGHVGFLAEMEPYQTQTIVEKVAARDYQVEERVTLQIDVLGVSGGKVWSSFAINEVSVEKHLRERMVEVLAQIDQRPVSRWSCDGVLVATPTGSTAYAFSAGGPVIWPDVDAFLVVPLSAHALFNRSLVVSPESIVDLDITPNSMNNAIIWCDGRRSTDAEPGQRIRVRQGAKRLKIARLIEQPFTTRLVRKFDLPIAGWRKTSGQVST